jgi:hypothetical protein
MSDHLVEVDVVVVGGLEEHSLVSSFKKRHDLGNDEI